jgi:hypothetical protein
MARRGLRGPDLARLARVSTASQPRLEQAIDCDHHPSQCRGPTQAPVIAAVDGLLGTEAAR